MKTCLTTINWLPSNAAVGNRTPAVSLISYNGLHTSNILENTP